jgi:8-oxo-dGTP diphosphatase
MGRSPSVAADEPKPDRLQGNTLVRLEVAAGILLDANGCVLLTDRVHASSMREFWEFPGGKLQPGETARAALKRELAEELGIQVRSCTHFRRLEHRYPDMHVVIDFFLVKKWSGVPVGLDDQELAWIAAAELGEKSLLPADAPLVADLQRYVTQR